MTMPLNAEQYAAFEAINAFLRDDAMDAFILRGGAGTGKTTLIAQVVWTLAAAHVRVGLLAPTARTARILAHEVREATGYNGVSGTVHGEVYELKAVEVREERKGVEPPGIRLTWCVRDRRSDGPSLLIVDEAALLGDRAGDDSTLHYGTGRLLQDLVTYARAPKATGRANRIKLLFAGDSAQMPPVGERTAPALSEEYLRTAFQLRVSAAELRTVFDSGDAILSRATELRTALEAGRFNVLSLRPCEGDVEEADAGRALDLVAGMVGAKKGVAVVTRTNEVALEHNRAIRARLWGDPDRPPQVGDMLLINRNSRKSELSNGDVVRLTQVGTDGERFIIRLTDEQEVELRFRNAMVAFREADRVVSTPCKLLENLLNSARSDLSASETQALWLHFRRRYPNSHPQSVEFRDAVLDDPYLNALQVRYGYAMTCHKAQGGKWPSVLVHFDAEASVRNPDFFRWVYTAITRARRKLIVVDPPEVAADSDLIWATLPDTPAEATPPPGQDWSTDPDWDRFSFHASIAALMHVHRHLRSEWQAQGIRVEQLQHLQHCERYTLARDGQRAVVQYHYNDKARVSRREVLPGAVSDPRLGEDALAAFLTLDTVRRADQPEVFIGEFLASLDAALDGSSIRRLGHLLMPHRLRVTVADASRSGDLDFTYNNKRIWTQAREARGPGSSYGLFEEIRALMMAAKKR